MSILASIYYNSIAENDKKLRFWEDYLKNLKSLNFETYAEHLKVPVLVPIGSRILFRGELKHTNEVTVALGADYFVKCSLKQAEVLRQHRIKDAESKLQSLRKEREYLENQVSFSKQTVFDDEGQEVIEVHNEDEDRIWREKHRKNVRRWKQNKTEETKKKEEFTDEELWERLEELELQEELENELAKENDSKQKHNDSFIDKEEDEWRQDTEINKENDLKAESDKDLNSVNDKKVTFAEEITKPTGKFELLQKVRDKQYELEEKLMELRNKDRGKSKTEQDLLAKLDEMDELEDLQDEMYRLVDMIDSTKDKSSDESEDEPPSVAQPVDIKRRVSFADEDDAETLEITFQHSDVQPSAGPYDPKKGITKPSDIYEAYSNLFGATTSILKKTKYEEKTNFVLPIEEKDEKKNAQWPVHETKTIVVKDVIEKVDVSDNKLENEKRPMSLFKQRRQQKK